MKFLKTRWEKFLLVIYVLAFVFSLVGLVITVFAMTHWDVGESVKLTREIFWTYGFLWGGVIIGLMHFIGAIIFPVILLFLKSKIEDDTITPIIYLINTFFWACIEAYAIFVFSSGFLDMTTNFFCLISFLKGIPREPPFSASIIRYVAIVLSLLTFILSASIRILKYMRSSFAKKQEN